MSWYKCPKISLRELQHFCPLLPQSVTRQRCFLYRVTLRDVCFMQEQIHTLDSTSYYVFPLQSCLMQCVCVCKH